VTGEASLGKPDPALARFVEARGLGVTDEGGLPLVAARVQAGGGRPGRETLTGGAPFVTFVQLGGPFGLTAPATYVRIPWTPRLASRDWLMILRLTAPDLLRAKKASWVEGPASPAVHQLQRRSQRGPLRRLLRPAGPPDPPGRRAVPAPRQLRGRRPAKIDEVSPPTSSRRLSESLEKTEVVSHFLDAAEGLTPQVLTIQFAYFSGLQSWAPVLIPTLFFVLGNLAAVALRGLARAGQRLAGRLQFSRPGRGPDGRQTG
jgi:hypothetical protein